MLLHGLRLRGGANCQGECRAGPHPATSPGPPRRLHMDSGTASPRSCSLNDPPLPPPVVAYHLEAVSAPPIPLRRTCVADSRTWPPSGDLCAPGGWRGRSRLSPSGGTAHRHNRSTALCEKKERTSAKQRTGRRKLLTLLMLIFCVGLPLYVGDHRPHRVLLYHIRLPDVDRL